MKKGMGLFVLLMLSATIAAPVFAAIDHAELARKWLAKKEWNKALVECEKALDDDPKNAAALAIRRAAEEQTTTNDLAGKVTGDEEPGAATVVDMAGKTRDYLPAVMPPKELHPCLLFRKEDIAGLQMRINEEPYRRWWTTVRYFADKDIDKPPDSELLWKGNQAKSAAFVYALTGEEKYGQRAIAVLSSLTPDFKDSYIHAPTGLSGCSVAYDIMVGMGTLSGSKEAECRKKLISVAKRFHSYVAKDIKSKKNGGNWCAKPAAALGVAALALSGDARARSWLNAALAALKTDFALYEDGPYCEGPGYALFSQMQAVPFAAFYRHAAGADLFAVPRFKAWGEWLAKIRMPNRRAPAIGDSFETDYSFDSYFAAFGGGADASNFRWSWENTPYKEWGGMKDLCEVDMICLFDKKDPPSRPNWEPTQFFPRGCQAVFRSDWDPDAIYAHFKGHPKVKNGSHEHRDSGSFVIFAFGEPLIIESGHSNYDDYNNEGKTQPYNYNAALAHNCLLIDGDDAGPTWNDGLMTEYGRSGDGYFAQLKIGYPKATLRRRLEFLQKTYFVITDEVQAAGKHTFEWVLHGEGKCVVNGNQVTWTSGNARILVTFKEPAVVITTHPGTHMLTTAQYPKGVPHTYIKATAQGKNPRFVVELRPSKISGDTK